MLFFIYQEFRVSVHKLCLKLFVDELSQTTKSNFSSCFSSQPSTRIGWRAKHLGYSKPISILKKSLPGTTLLNGHPSAIILLYLPQELVSSLPRRRALKFVLSLGKV